MASIQKRPNGKYRARYRDADGKEHARHFALKRDAQAWLDEKTASIVTGQYVDPKASAVAWAAWTTRATVPPNPIMVPTAAAEKLAGGGRRRELMRRS